MKTVRIPVILASIYLLLYTFLSGVLPGSIWVLLLFTFSPIIVIWMVWQVLKYGTPSAKTFDEGHWYDDKDINQIKAP